MYQRKSDGLWCEKVPGRKAPLTCKTKAGLKQKLLEYGKQAAEMGHSNAEMTRKYANIEKLLRKSSIGNLDKFVSEGGTVEVQQKPKPIDIP